MGCGVSKQKEKEGGSRSSSSSRKSSESENQQPNNKPPTTTQSVGATNDDAVRSFSTPVKEKHMIVENVATPQTEKSMVVEAFSPSPAPGQLQMNQKKLPPIETPAKLPPIDPKSTPAGNSAGGGAAPGAIPELGIAAGNRLGGATKLPPIAWTIDLGEEGGSPLRKSPPRKIASRMGPRTPA
eukprot:comp17652_c0_seq1/m.30197 comp17652_c0_seq1/g.30197  ORF comp17652_c0_seq1/g.30197 comp17652_c0_seq1/m.30197 type:complete len:183 (+) comp17652_c0_seq1:53-601(+)